MFYYKFINLIVLFFKSGTNLANSFQIKKFITKNDINEIIICNYSILLNLIQK